MLKSSIHKLKVNWPAAAPLENDSNSIVSYLVSEQKEQKPAITGPDQNQQKLEKQQSSKSVAVRMATESNFVQPAIPKLDAHYDHWCMLMENFLRSKEYWNLIEQGILTAEAGVELTEGQKKQKYQGTARVQRAQRQALRKEFEMLNMKVGESVNEYFARTLTIANKMRVHGEKMEDVVVIENILRSMTPKFNYVVCSIEESNDLDTLSIDVLQISLLVHEQRMNGHLVEEQALKVTYEDQSRGRGRGRGGFRGRRRGGSRQSFDKSTIECYNCHKLGHFQYECPNKETETKAQYAEASGEILLMAHADGKEASKEELWFLDSGCINHMCGKKELFSRLDESFSTFVKLGDNSSMANNLLSVGQLQEKGLAILIQHGKCKIYHPDRGLIMEIAMSSNRMFILPAQKLLKEEICLSSFTEDQARLWHLRYGHLSFNDLKTLQQKRLVNGLPQFQAPLKVCEDCLVGKQRRNPFPKESTWRASQILQLVHADICGPINPTSNSKKREKEPNYYEYGAKHAFRKKIPKTFWPEAVNWTVYVLNRSPTLVVKDMTPEEAWSGSKPSVDHFRVFGCISHVHIPDSKRTKLDDKSVKCVLLGVSEELKAYRLYDPVSQKIIVSRDVKFEEENSWDWNKSHEKPIIADLDWGESDKEAVLVDTNRGNFETDHHDITIEAMEGNDSYESNEENPLNPNEGRIRRPPAWLRDYASGKGLSEEEDTAYQALFVGNDPVSFGDAVKSMKWRKAMDAEIEAIDRNDTWELTDLPTEAKKVGVKWIYKTKFNENGEVDKYKARLVAKGYTQEHEVDYTEVFAPVARLDTIRVVISLAALKEWTIYQLDVKSAFLHGELSEEGS
ncbi:Retrovirus-related Pol polyprotein from transposon TNT 1-94 [Vitis vinifera]|uniref:Retrovirus-related Pol polyprotein from transposon TNT 1-94 n=1 Tax=Vitis vinifera TaxID=29760 RepID=A0A438KRZ7_VITVI|nr:Retrovirus-related Pol polyprotein from transposon TNT 1-94 [Vitis vinifera]